MASNETILELRNVDAGYGEIEVLRDISLSVEAGQIVSIVGANGAGKSTLLKTIFGTVKPSRGTIAFRGQDVTRSHPREILRLGMAYAPEGRANFPAMTVQENLEMGAYTRSDQKQVQVEIDELCAQFPILQEKRHVAAGNLSGGQQQMLEIAMGLILRPKLILIDEPTLGLAPILVDEVFRVIQRINETGTTVILVEQNAPRALDISHYGFVLELGRIRYQGPAAELSDNEEVYAAYLGER